MSENTENVKCEGKNDLVRAFLANVLGLGHHASVGACAGACVQHLKTFKNIIILGTPQNEY